ncbi:hypothetical protein PT160_01655 [Erysipelothrix rhusiopathiae]|uniref:hypothetical protein n=1 Tax=Erysipelothrix rhusiopathiae TaxID=1648 RepID=UPI000F438AC2|nr:hypothetical protein [Erysipelothrix rhusiopathiae]AYV33872.1 hypothetical protein EEY85_00555 [Erysipelothrix rhusiopathiae]MDE8081470.1 hypothetical protein [Erysipelothrix rhusiopathiae]MDE8117515.1 hypothetical protein [Erysipelothrix rhusiopathiae]MDE8201814.1 hypothetical protein [Erysipelothrix rhusiopathiae]MDE8267885.1 hypothetical protein [Erysipelothrix rhusiopathiae]
MGLVYAMSEIKDKRQGGHECTFNGFLEDYLNFDTAQYKELLENVLEMDDSIRVMENVRIHINKDLVANKIIRYKDVHKIPKGYIKAPLILYSEGQEREFALILVDRNYLEAKGIYYCLTEQGGILGAFRHNVLVLPIEETEIILELLKILPSDRPTIASLQREQDRRHYRDTEMLIETAIAKGQENITYINQSLRDDPQGRADRIHQTIASWYLLKKMLYVQYMMDKDTLLKINNGDIKLHRQKAKEHCNKIEFIPFSELWRI